MTITEMPPVTAVTTGKAAGIWRLAMAVRDRWTRTRLGPREQIIGCSLSPEAWNLLREDDCSTVRLLENDEICDWDPVGNVSFGEITPEDIIGEGVGDRDWSQRSEREKPVWHLHVSFAGEPGVICTEVHGDTDDEAGCAAISEALVHLETAGIWDEDKVSGWLQILQDEGYCLHLYALGEYCSPDGCPGIRVAAT